MLNHNLHDDLFQCRIYRLLFLLFLAFFATYPLVEAYSDYACLPHDFFKDINDSDSDDIVAIDELNNIRKSFHELKSSKHVSRAYRAGLQQASIKDALKSHVIKIQHSAHDIKSSQIYPPISSDLSPPVI